MTFNGDQDTNRQRGIQSRRNDATSSTKTMVWVVGAAVLVLIAGYMMFFFPTSDRLKLVEGQSTATAPARTGSSSTKLTHPGGDEPRTPSAVVPTIPTEGPAPKAPTAPPSR